MDPKDVKKAQGFDKTRPTKVTELSVVPSTVIKAGNGYVREFGDGGVTITPDHTCAHKFHPTDNGTREYFQKALKATQALFPDAHSATLKVTTTLVE